MSKIQDSSPQKINLWQALERPPVGAENYRMSPQIREIPLNSTAFLPLVSGKNTYVFVLKSLVWQVFNQYAEQDLRIGIFIGKSAAIYSGKWDATAALVTKTPFNYPWLISETRTTAAPGRPHSVISNATGTGFHDNYSPKDGFENVYLAGDKNESVYLRIENQSTIHNHNIEVSFNGWAFSPKYLEVFS